MEILRNYALSFVGLQYKWGGDDPIKGFDCSGLIQEFLSSVGIDPPGDQTAQGLFNEFEKKGNWNEHGCGALCFYGKSVTSITHVAMMIDKYRIIEAGGGGAKTNTLEDAANHNAFVRVRHLHYRSDLIAVIKPKFVKIGLV